MPYNVLAGMAQGGMLKSPLDDYMEGRQQAFQNSLAQRQQQQSEQRDREQEDYRRRVLAQQAAEADQKATREFVLSAVDSLSAAESNPEQFSRVASEVAAHPIARKLGVTLDQITPQNVAALRVRLSAGPPAPRSTDPGELVQLEDGTYSTRAGAVGKKAYVKPDKPDNAPSAPSGYRWGAGGALEPIPGGPADPSGPAARRTVAPLRKEFDSLQSVKDLKTVLPLVDSATRAPDTGYGDLQLIYTVGKVLDPGSVVREGELQLALQAGSPLQRLLGTSSFVVGKSGRLTPELRSQIKAMLAERVASYKSAYDQDRSIYEKYASDYNVDPTQVVGKHPMEAYKPQETRKEAPPAALEYLKAHPDQAENFRKKYGYLPGG